MDKSLQAVTEPMLTGHFEDNVIGILFAKFTKNVAQYLTVQKKRHITIVVVAAEYKYRKKLIE